MKDSETLKARAIIRYESEESVECLRLFFRANRAKNRKNDWNCFGLSIHKIRPLWLLYFHNLTNYQAARSREHESSCVELSYLVGTRRMDTVDTYMVFHQYEFAGEYLNDQNERKLGHKFYTYMA